MFILPGVEDNSAVKAKVQLDQAADQNAQA